MGNISSVSELRSTVISNAGVFAAAFARAPRSITYKGKHYTRDAARSVDERLWYLAAAAQTQPSAISSIVSGSYSLDEVYGLDPDRSGIDEAEATLRAASAKVGKVKAQLDGIKRRVRDAESQLTMALAAQKEAQKVQVGDIFTAGVSAAARNLYADGQVQMWKDRISALKNGANVGLASEGGWTVPTNAGQSQLESALMDAKAEESAARAAVVEARAAYDREAAARRKEEEAARIAQARDAADAARAQAEAAAREQAAAAATQTQTQNNAPPVYASNDTDPGYVAEDPNVYGGEEAAWYEEELDTARELFGDEDDARAYAEDVLGLDAEANIGLEVYASPFAFDNYYAGGAYGLDEDSVDDMRLAFLDAGWGFDGLTLGYDADDADGAYGADKITEEGEQGFVPSMTPPPMPATGGAAAPFDFMSILPIIIAAVLAFAPLIIKALGGPSPVEDTSTPKDTAAELAAQRERNAAAVKEESRSTEAGLYAGGLLLAVKILGA